jgi:hypothetical protein
MSTTVINATEYRNLPLSLLTESATNPRRIFEDAALKEFADYVAKHIIGVLCRWAFCGRRRQKAHSNWRTAFRATHNDHNESSHFNSSSSLLHALLRGDVTEDPTGGRHAATAAIFPLRVISAYR